MTTPSESSGPAPTAGSAGVSSTVDQEVQRVLIDAFDDEAWIATDNYAETASYLTEALLRHPDLLFRLAVHSGAIVEDGFKIGHEGFFTRHPEQYGGRAYTVYRRVSTDLPNTRQDAP